ncbi:MAG: DUF6491 family protein [Desulfobacteraceae bacterium]|jgi:hypothetical protein
MKVIIKVASVFILFIMVVACATTARVLPEKYNLDDELEAVDQITAFRQPDWEEVDKQSIILELSYKDFYLLVLRRPIETMLPTTIGIPGTSTITAGFDQIVVTESGVAQYYNIEKIYKLKGREQVNEIKERFGKK